MKEGNIVGLNCLGNPDVSSEDNEGSGTARNTERSGENYDYESLPVSSHSLPVTDYERTPLKELFLFFASAVGCTVGWTAILSNLVYYTETLGVDSFLILNLSIYAPLLPVTLAQAIWDTRFDQKFSSLSSFSFRGAVGYSVSLACLVLLPVASKSLILLSTASLLLGLASAVLHGMLKQMASFVYPNCGRLSAAVTAGMQASAIFVFLVSSGAAHGFADRNIWLWQFYLSICGILTVCWICFQVLLTSSHGILQSMLRRDSSFGPEGMDEPLISAQGQETLSVRDTNEMSLWQLWLKTWPACLAVMLTVGSSMSVASWFNRVPSQDANSHILPQILFYTRLLADLLGRPATLVGHVRATISPLTLVVISILRLGLVPVFFLYASSSNVIPKNDVAAVVFVFLFAFSSGYIATLSYQMAPILLSAEDREQNTLKQTSLVNVCFSSAVLVGVVVTFVLKEGIIGGSKATLSLVSKGYRAPTY
jgi:hypothetical protein